MQVHGSRFMVVGQYIADLRTAARKECFEFYEKAALFEAVVHRGHPRARPDRLERRFGLADLRQRIATDFATLNTLTLLLVLGGWAVARHTPQKPEYEGPVEVDADPAKTFDLGKPLFPGAKRGRPRRAIPVAASGGGTRAALSG